MCCLQSLLLSRGKGTDANHTNVRGFVDPYHVKKYMIMIMLNALALVDVIMILHQGSKPHPMAKGPLDHSLITLPTPFLRSLLFSKAIPS